MASTSRHDQPRPTWAGLIRSTLPAPITPEPPAEEYELFPLATQQGYDRYQELAADMEPKQAMARASAEEEQHQVAGIPMSSELAATMAREVRIGAACELYTRRQVTAFAARQAAADRAWQDYQQAMLAADTAYDAAMAEAGAGYNRVVGTDA